MMSERRDKKSQKIDYDTQVDVISKRNSEPVGMSPKSYASNNYSVVKSIRSAKEAVNTKNSLEKPSFNNDNLYQSYIQRSANKKV